MKSFRSETEWESGETVTEAQDSERKRNVPSHVPLERLLAPADPFRDALKKGSLGDACTAVPDGVTLEAFLETLATDEKGAVNVAEVKKLQDRFCEIAAFYLLRTGRGDMAPVKAALKLCGKTATKAAAVGFTPDQLGALSAETLVDEIAYLNQRLDEVTYKSVNSLNPTEIDRLYNVLKNKVGEKGELDWVSLREVAQQPGSTVIGSWVTDPKTGKKSIEIADRSVFTSEGDANANQAYEDNFLHEIGHAIHDSSVASSAEQLMKTAGWRWDTLANYQVAYPGSRPPASEYLPVRSDKKNWLQDGFYWFESTVYGGAVFAVTAELAEVVWGYESRQASKAPKEWYAEMYVRWVRGKPLDATTQAHFDGLKQSGFKAPTK
ncbi:MAG: hypothetical protein SFX73_26280 [Kofleriaceae bacterium]|nr:hypothetical protein [Kofleriaceae bacterium]